MANTLYLGSEIVICVVLKVWYSKTETLRKETYCMNCKNFFIENIIEILELCKQRKLMFFDIFSQSIACC